MNNLLERLGVDGLFKDVQRMDKRQVNEQRIFFPQFGSQEGHVPSESEFTHRFFPVLACFRVSRSG